MQQFHIEIEMNHKRHVLLGAQHLFEEPETGRPLFFNQPALAAAGVHQQAEREGQVALLGEIGDRLGAAILLQDKIVLGEVLHDTARLVTHIRKQIDHLDAGGKRGPVLLRSTLPLLGSQQT